MTNVNENEKVNTKLEETWENQDTESEEEAKEKLESNRNQDSKKAKKNAEARKLVRQEHRFLNTKNFYEEITIIVKLAFNNYFSFLKEKEQIKECDEEEFLKSENTEEFQNQKIRLQNTLKEGLFATSDNDPFDFALKIFGIYGWKAFGLFNK